MNYKNMTLEEEREEAIKLLNKVLNMKDNEDIIGTISNNLLHLIDCDSIDILESFFDKAELWHHYGVLTFIIDEGYVRNCPNLMPLLKKIHLLKNPGHDYWILDRYIELCKTKKDMEYVIEKLIGKDNDRLIPNLYWGISGMTDKQLDILALFDKLGGYPLYLFDKKIVKDIDFFKKEILNKDKIYQEIIFLSAVIRKFSKKELFELVKLSRNSNLINWYCPVPPSQTTPP